MGTLVTMMNTSPGDDRKCGSAGLLVYEEAVDLWSNIYVMTLNRISHLEVCRQSWGYVASVLPVWTVAMFIQPHTVPRITQCSHKSWILSSDELDMAYFRLDIVNTFIINIQWNSNLNAFYVHDRKWKHGSLTLKILQLFLTRMVFYISPMFH